MHLTTSPLPQSSLQNGTELLATRLSKQGTQGTASAGKGPFWECWDIKGQWPGLAWPDCAVCPSLKILWKAWLYPSVVAFHFHYWKLYWREVRPFHSQWLQKKILWLERCKHNNNKQTKAQAGVRQSLWEEKQCPAVPWTFCTAGNA